MTTIIAMLVGAVSGAGIVIAMLRSGMLAERSGAAILLAAIASFYPVFAVIDGDILAAAIHVAIFAAFAILATRAYRIGLNLIAGGLIAHGLFDLALGPIGAPGPMWW